MGFFKNLFSKTPINTNADFWDWFLKNEKDFFKIVKNNKNIESGFFDKLSPKLEELKEGYLFLTGMLDDNTAELILTADGIVKNIGFVEELVNDSPKIEGWKFTALKPALEVSDTNIEMADFKFCQDNLNFYYNEFEAYPDQIELVIAHDDYTIKNKDQIISGIYIFLDNYLGELEFASNIDNIEFVAKKEAIKELIPISKLKDFLIWRQKEFIEKYEGVRYNTEKDEHSILEAKLENGNSLLAVINTELLKWERKASHPWVAILTFKYDGKDFNGMPSNVDFEKLNDIHDEVMEDLKDFDGYLNIGRQTAEGERDVYFACKDFRKPSKVFYQIQRKHAKSFEIDYNIYKDKYWQSFNKFNQD